MTVVIGMLVAAALAFGLGWLSKPKYSEGMSRSGQVLLVAGVALLAALVIGYVVAGEGGWTFVGICLLPLVFVAPYAGGYVREQQAKVHH